MNDTSAQRPQHQCCAVVLAAALSTIVALSCAGCGGDETTTTRTTTTTTTTITTTTFAVDSPCIAGSDVQKCVDYLNEHYMGYDPANESSPVGVTIRGQPRFNDKWFYCTNVCFRGQPDCYVAASLLNRLVMLSEKKTPAMPMDYAVGFIFQPSAVREHLVKCAWDFDGAAFNRLNGGCGPGAPSHDCDRDDTAFKNICPSTGKPVDEGCQDIDREWCVSKPSTVYPATCFWKGPAFYSSATPNVEPNLTSGPDELRPMLKQRLGDQSGKTGDGTPLLTYWNELTIDGKVLEAMLQNNPPAAIAGVMYQKGNEMALGWAREYVDQFEKDYKYKLLIVAMDMGLPIHEGIPGPFSAPEQRVRAMV